MMCKVDGCERVAVAKGHCDMHRQRLRDHGGVGPSYPFAHRSSDVCVVDECNGAYEAKGYCNMHYQRLNLHGTVDKPRRGYENGKGNKNKVIHSYRGKAKRRGLDYAILQNDDIVEGLLQGNCHYCGAAPSNISNSKGHNDAYIYNGIDRVDSSKGYVDGNCVSCCKVCNRAKSDMPVDVFFAWAQQVSERIRDV